MPPKTSQTRQKEEEEEEGQQKGFLSSFHLDIQVEKSSNENETWKVLN